MEVKYCCMFLKEKMMSKLSEKEKESLKQTPMNEILINRRKHYITHWHLLIDFYD
jgi:hypothetical protein